MGQTSKKILIAIPAFIILALLSFYFLFPGSVYKIIRDSERSSASLAQKNIDIGNLHFEYLDGGNGEVLLLLHGFGANKDNWTRVAKYLTPHFRVIAPDIPGFGESTRDMDAKYTFNAQADRLHEFVKASNFFAAKRICKNFSIGWTEPFNS